MKPISVNIVLVTLTVDKGQLALVLQAGEQGLPAANVHEGDEPDSVAAELASGLSGTDRNLERHGFMAKTETGQEPLSLIYCQLLPWEEIFPMACRRVPLPYGDVVALDLNPEWHDRVVARVVADVRSDLKSVMKATHNKKGLIRLLNLLPRIFDHKELSASYLALSGEKPPSSLMLARMMLDHYTMGAGEKAREVRGRDLIREYQDASEDLFDEKKEKNKDLYRTGGPKAKRLYIKSGDSDADPA